MTTLPRLLITPGEPAGVGVDVTVRIAQKAWNAELIAIADPDILLQRAKETNLPLKLITADINSAPITHVPGTLKIIPIKLNAPVITGQLNAANASYVMQTLKTAAELCLQKKANALVTGPVHKEIMNKANIHFTGHTELFADISGVKKTVMLFVVDQLKVALATTHVPLNKVSNNITKENLQEIIIILDQALKNKFNIKNPNILICGLNPHAGEGGYLGTEEINIITPALEALRAQHISVTGPLPADTIFTPNILKTADAVLSMYHDQALPLIKYLGFNHAVNVTLGLPFIRTSVDHGTALSIAGTEQVDSGSMSAAVKLAIEMV